MALGEVILVAKEAAPRYRVGTNADRGRNGRGGGNMGEPHLAGK